ncbi:MAG: hypothetical protein PHQ40_00825 [Anaerolineaceae bacterium]|nr:hypothetical protein [Anaerolineaceae bacterium]
MPIPDYFQEINEFSSPNGHPSQADFLAEGLATPDPTTGHLVWNVAGQAMVQEIVSTRFELSIAYYRLIRELEARLPDPHVARQLISRGYYAMFTAARSVSLSACKRDWGMGRGNHGTLPQQLDALTTGDSWHPNFHNTLLAWHPLRNCADYNLLTQLIYTGRYAGRYPNGVRSTAFNDLELAALVICDTVEEYLNQSQRFITSRGYHLAFII